MDDKPTTRDPLFSRPNWRDLPSLILGRWSKPPPVLDALALPATPPTRTGTPVVVEDVPTGNLTKSPIEALLLDARAAGVRVLDLRSMDRKVLYRAKDHCVLIDGKVASIPAKLALSVPDNDFGPWGYFKTKRDGKWVYAETPPTRGLSHGVSPWARMTSTVIHTAAVTMHAARYIGVPAQHGIASDGTIVLCHPINAYMYHADAANRFSDGIEISGEGTITEKQTTAARILLRYIDAEKARQGVTRRHVTPHAFSQKLKSNDPGATIWSAVGQWAQDTLGMTLGPIVGSGVHPAWVSGTPSNRKNA